MSDRNDLPPLRRDRAFHGMTATQFLGAFNDNVFKQLVLLICVDYVIQQQLEKDTYQPIAQGLFALPFVLFSGFGGFLSDIRRKRSVIVLCKVAEIVVMTAGMVAFLAGELYSSSLIVMLFGVLFLMGMQSAFFGPAKYGILPEMLHEHDLPAANGVIQMTTFLAIIFGTAAAGFAKTWFQDRLWMVSGLCVLIAITGTLTSLIVRRTPVADPDAKFDLSAIGINRHTWKLLRSDRSLLGVLLVSSLFWFVGGTLLPAVNTFGKQQLGLGDERTSLLAACMGAGIAVGCLLAGRLSGKRVNFRLVTAGAWGIAITLGLLALAPLSGLAPQTVEWESRLLLTAMGCSAGIFAVPLQVYLQARPPDDQKGRMIGTMNLINWIGILLAAGFYFGCSAVFTPKHISGTFAVLAVVMLPVALFYHPRDEQLE